MVLRNVLLLLLVCFFMASCERVPDWERGLRDKGQGAEAERVTQVKKWIWACRGSISRMNRETQTRWIGEDFEAFLDYFRNRDLTILDVSGSKILMGSGIFWSTEHLVMVSSDPEELTDVECSNGISGWLPAKLQAYDRFLTLGVWRLEGAKSFLNMASRWTVPAGEPSTTHEGREVMLVASLMPGHLDQMKVGLQMMRGPLPVSLDRDLLLFLPTPPRVLKEGFLFDSQWRLLGISLGLERSPWGTALRADYLDRAVRDLLSVGRVARPSLGMLVRYVNDVGFVVQQVDVGGAAYEAGLRTNDLILRIKDRDLRKLRDWEDVTATEIGKLIPVKYARDDKAYETQIKIKSAE